MFFDLTPPAWSTDGRDWPNRSHSRFVTSSRLSFHVQEMGAPEGPETAPRPKVLLLHGTGASSHSYRDLLPLLAADFHVLVPDLPGHGFTRAPGNEGLSLPGMARLLGGLLRDLDFMPDMVVGHSAGAAILCAMTLEKRIEPRVVVAINGALKPIKGAALFSPLAKLLFLNPLAPRLFARRAMDREATRRLLEGTGSQIDARGVDLYARLFSTSGHVGATLGMMANWDLDRLERDLRRLAVPLVLVTSAGDRAVPPRDGELLAARLPTARLVALDTGGHLVHEERPVEMTGLLKGIATEAGLLAGRAGVSPAPAAS